MTMRLASGRHGLCVKVLLVFGSQLAMHTEGGSEHYCPNPINPMSWGEKTKTTLPRPKRFRPLSRRLGRGEASAENFTELPNPSLKDDTLNQPSDSRATS